MKQYFFLLVLVFAGLTSYAQTDAQDELAKRVETLENKVAQQDAQLTQLIADLNSAISQNLALKKNLNLKPTVAKAKTGPIEYRVLEVKGDPITKEVKVVFSAENTSDIDSEVYYRNGVNFDIIDETGNGYNSNERQVASIDGVSKRLVSEIVYFHPNTPLTINLLIKGFNTTAQYIKFLELVSAVDNVQNQKAVFKNLPIKWEEE